MVLDWKEICRDRPFVESSDMSTIFKQLNLREKILLGLLVTGAVIEDLADRLYEPFDLYHRGVGPSRESYEYFREKENSSRKTLYFLAAAKLISRSQHAGQDSYLLTEEGLNLIFKKFPKLKYGNRTWDGYWRVVVYDIPEKDKKLRVHLRSQLRYLGFKFLQRSVWVSPFAVENDLEAFLKKERLWGKILVLKSKLPDLESQRWAKIFKVALKPERVFDSRVERQIHQLLSDPLLPKGI